MNHPRLTKCKPRGMQSVPERAWEAWELWRKGALKTYADVAEHCGVSPHTVNAWFQQIRDALRDPMTRRT